MTTVDAAVPSGASESSSPAAERMTAAARLRALLSSHADLVIGVALFVAVVALLVPFARIDPDPHHEGLVLKNALDVAHGQALYTESFNQYGPLYALTNAAIVFVFGDRLLALRLVYVGLFAGIYIGLFWIWARALGRILALGAVAVAILLMPVLTPGVIVPFLPWSSVQGLLWTVLALACFVRLLAPIERWRGIVIASCGGAALAAVSLVRGPSGVLAAITIAALLIVRHLRGRRVFAAELLGWAGGFAATSFAVGIVIVGSGATSEFWEQSVSLPRRWYRGIGDAYGTVDVLLEHFAQAAARVAVVGIVLAAAVLVVRARSTRWRAVGFIAMSIGIGAAAGTWSTMEDLLEPYELWFELPLLAALAAVVAFVALVWQHAWRGEPAGVTDRRYVGSTRWLALLATAVVGVGGIVQFYAVPDAYHLFFGAVITVGPTIALFEVLASRWLAWIVVLVLVVGLVPSAFDRADETLSRPRRHVAGVVTALRGMLVSDDAEVAWAGDLERLARLLRKHPATPVLVEGLDAMPAVVAPDLTNADRYFVDWGEEPWRQPNAGFEPSMPRDEAAIDRFIRSRRPAIVVNQARPNLEELARSQGYRLDMRFGRSCRRGLPTKTVNVRPCTWLLVPLEWTER